MAREINVIFIPLKPGSSTLIPYKIVKNSAIARDGELVAKMDKIDFKVFSCLFAKRLSNYGVDDILTDDMKKYCMEIKN